MTGSAKGGERGRRTAPTRTPCRGARARDLASSGPRGPGVASWRELDRVGEKARPTAGGLGDRVVALLGRDTIADEKDTPRGIVTGPAGWRRPERRSPG